jgi:hypothetical protein
VNGIDQLECADRQRRIAGFSGRFCSSRKRNFPVSRAQYQHHLVDGIDGWRENRQRRRIAPPIPNSFSSLTIDHAHSGGSTGSPTPASIKIAGCDYLGDCDHGKLLTRLAEPQGFPGKSTRHQIPLSPVKLGREEVVTEHFALRSLLRESATSAQSAVSIFLRAVELYRPGRSPLAPRCRLRAGSWDGVAARGQIAVLG